MNLDSNVVEVMHRAAVDLVASIRTTNMKIGAIERELEDAKQHRDRSMSRLHSIVCALDEAGVTPPTQYGADAPERSWRESFAAQTIPAEAGGRGE